MPIRGVRGAITVDKDEEELVLKATKELLAEILEANPTMRIEDVASCLFTSTNDLVSVFPAKAAREIGWTDVPLICALEIPVPNSLPRCVRVLIHWNTEISQTRVKPVYLGGATSLRPDQRGNNE